MDFGWINMTSGKRTPTDQMPTSYPGSYGQIGPEQWAAHGERKIVVIEEPREGCIVKKYGVFDNQDGMTVGIVVLEQVEIAKEQAEQAEQAQAAYLADISANQERYIWENVFCILSGILRGDGVRSPLSVSEWVARMGVLMSQNPETFAKLKTGNEACKAVLDAAIGSHWPSVVQYRNVAELVAAAEGVVARFI